MLKGVGAAYSYLNDILPTRSGMNEGVVESKVVSLFLFIYRIIIIAVLS